MARAPMLRAWTTPARGLCISETKGLHGFGKRVVPGWRGGLPRSVREIAPSLEQCGKNCPSAAQQPRHCALVRTVGNF